MFDRYGRMLCRECGGQMQCAEIANGEALFGCDDCHHVEVIDWATGPARYARKIEQNRKIA